MNVKNLGEFGLIEMIKKMVGTSSTVVKGIGDDCAVLPFDRNNFFLLTCDMLVEDEDFTRRDKPYWVGRKSLGCCLSDVAASGGKPVYAQVCLGLPSRITVNWVRWLYRGIIYQAKEFGVKIVGGDLSRSDKLVIDISLTGLVERKNLALRQGAKKGDIIFVSGELGGSIYPQTKGLGAGAHAKHLTFMPRVKEARYLVENYKINSMIDISDGLIQDLGHILKQASLGAVLFKELIPLSARARSFDEALYMGEDFELLFTLSPAQARRLLRSKKNKIFSPIGEIVDKASGLVLLDRQARRIRLKSLCGFRHF